MNEFEWLRQLRELRQPLPPQRDLWAAISAVVEERGHSAHLVSIVFVLVFFALVFCAHIDDTAAERENTEAHGDDGVSEHRPRDRGGTHNRDLDNPAADGVERE